MENLIERVKHAFRAARADDADDGDVNSSLYTLLSIMPLASIVVDGDGEVLVASPSTYELGVVSNEAIADPTLDEELRLVLERGGTRSFELVTRTPRRMAGADAVRAPQGRGASDARADADGTDDAVQVSRRNWLKVHVGKLDDNHAVALVEDLSERKRFERIRDEFVVNVTARLMDPTHALERLAAELESEDTDIEMLSWHATEVRRRSTELDHLISDLLLLLKAQEPIVPSASNRMRLMDAVDRAIAPLRGRIEQRRMKLHVAGDETVEVHGDMELLVGALTKLVENALDYSPEQKTIGVAVAKSKDGGSAVIRVIDNGQGIPKEQQDRIFERFWRGDPSAPASHATGLGLSIAKHVALTHHGTLTVWSAKGRGSTFTMTLPLASDDEGDKDGAADDLPSVTV